MTAETINYLLHCIEEAKNKDWADGIKFALAQELATISQEPKCKDCKWWKDNDGKYRRGYGAESRCPMNTNAVYYGEGYCYMFSPKIESEG